MLKIYFLIVACKVNTLSKHLAVLLRHYYIKKYTTYINCLPGPNQ